MLKNSKLDHLFKVTKPTKTIYMLLPLLGSFLVGSFTIPNSIYILVHTLIFGIFYGGIYILNDLIDYQYDKKDPIKKERMISSGKITITEGIIMAILLIGFGLGVSYYTNIRMFWCLVILIVVNIIYDVFTKKFPYVDSFWIGSTAILKIAVGMVLLNPISILRNYTLFFVMIYFLGSSLGLEKKIRELHKGQKRHFYLGKYTFKGIDFVQKVVLGIMIILLPLSSKTDILLNTAIILIYSIWLYIVKKSDIKNNIYEFGENFSQGYVKDA
jgi:4-hydroxybenzoate polyprenyltransferase